MHPLSVLTLNTDIKGGLFENNFSLEIPDCNGCGNVSRFGLHRFGKLKL